MWKVTFEKDGEEPIVVTVTCHWAYNAPKVAIKQLGSEAPCVDIAAKATRVTVEAA